MIVANDRREWTLEQGLPALERYARTWSILKRPRKHGYGKNECESLRFYAKIEWSKQNCYSQCFFLRGIQVLLSIKNNVIARICFHIACVICLHILMHIIAILRYYCQCALCNKYALWRIEKTEKDKNRSEIVTKCAKSANDPRTLTLPYFESIGRIETRDEKERSSENRRRRLISDAVLSSFRDAVLSSYVSGG
jgi:hypothetical protein